MFEFDEKKNKGNLAKHGVKLEEAQKLWNAEHIVIPARSFDQDRYLILGEYKKLYVAVFTIRDTNIRLISFHRADKRLERFYYEKNK